MLQKVSNEYSDRIVQFVGVYWDKKKIVLFTEYMPQGTIKSHIVQKPLEEKIALKYFYQAAQGLKFLHHRNDKELTKTRIVHRNIKCDNLLLTGNFDVKLADFGLAHNLSVDDDSHSASMDLGYVGTLFHSAPEVLRGEKYGRGADVWSLGCTLVEMLTKDPPYMHLYHEHKERAEFIIMQKAQGDPKDQLKYSGNLLPTSASSAEVRRLLNCIFVKNKMKRATIDNILEVLELEVSNEIFIDHKKLLELESKIR